MKASLEYTSLDDIDNIVQDSKRSSEERQRRLAHAENPRAEDLALRLKELRSLYFGLKDHEEEIIDALHQDLHRSRHESLGLELIPLYNNILALIENLPRYIEPEKVQESSLLFKLSSVKVERIALGSVLVISPFNYPVLLGIDPVAAAIGAGNSVVWKPSELAPATAVVMERIIVSSVNPSWIKVVQGEIPETTRLIENPNFDKIFYTGSTKVGRIVSQAAAKNLIPVILELGGKSPVFITENLTSADLKRALKRTFFGAFNNSGQTCVASDYVLIHESQLEKARELTSEILDDYWPDFNQDTEFSSMINDQAYKKAIERLENTKGTIFQPSKVAGELAKRCIPPSVIFNVTWDDSLMEEENFSPVLPFIVYHDIDNVMEQVVTRHPDPLALYIFSQNQREINKIMNSIKSGGCAINDTIIHVGTMNAPFGGIGQSGQGSYHGKWSYQAFTHERTVLQQRLWMEFLDDTRNPPYNSNKLAILRTVLENDPGFNRSGSTVWFPGKLVVVLAVLVALVAVTLRLKLVNF
ncbi:LADA_0G09736g1_1 [Lachancea dasiensis]|uniref:Aldehyde dehydrogenase n=1 Tax=Lachancea dasiensis TaxID=1072105 RepID=A0A1G4JUH3_9SACH|nr:LADA_0G09736g1_1 [Lachancea dasiensis]